MNIRFTYKCRRCGALEDAAGCSGTIVRATMLLVDALDGVKTPEPMAVSLFSVHVCGPDGRGISDLIGFSTEPEAAPLPSAGAPHLQTVIS